MADKNLYSDDSIQSLSPRDFTRLRPGVYAGSTEYSTQLLIEILSNAIDEHDIGHGDKIEVELGDAGSCRVRDYGQGFPVNILREDGETVLQASFDVMNTSGKYDEDGVYEGNANGLNGIGSKLTNFLSKRMTVTTWRDSKFEKIEFVDGVFSKRQVGDDNKTPSGTYIEWIPDEQFFTNVHVDTDRVIEFCTAQAALAKNLTFELKQGGKVLYTISSKNGLADLLDSKGTELIKNRLEIDHVDGKNKMQFLMTFTSSYSFSMKSYVNKGMTDAGPHITQTKAIITREFNKFFKEKKWLKVGEANLPGEDIQEGLTIIASFVAPGVAYDAQTKTRVVKLDMTPFSSVIAENLQYWFFNNEKDVKVIFDRAISARKAREAAKRAREAVRNVGGKKDKKAILDLPTKLVDCWGKDRSKCELLIAEGDSAANGLVKCRDAEVHAIFPIRGKILAVYKAKLEKILANQEIVNIIKALGLEMSPQGKLTYDPKKLRYGKILLCADADPDGQNIKNLLLELFWWLCPELIINGHVYTTLPPLYRITDNKNNYIYLTDKKALDTWTDAHKGQKYIVNRNKGLGEQNAEELYPALIDVKTRNIKQVMVNDTDNADWLMEVLMGPSVPPRRAYLLEHSEEAKGENE